MINFHNHGYNYYAQCSDWKCPSKAHRSSRKEVVDTWNTRAETPEIERLRQRVKESEGALGLAIEWYEADGSDGRTHEDTLDKLRKALTPNAEGAK